MAKIETPAQTPIERSPLKVVVAGGFAAGKSALINLIMRTEMLERHVGFQRSPLLRLVGSDSAPICYETDSAGLRAQVTDMHAAFGNPNAEIVEQTSPLAALANMEIIEYPADEFGEINADHLGMVADADLLIWCTIGSQAWRLTEKTALARLREGFDGRVMLVVSRADHFRNADDLGKVRQRLEREVEGIAQDIVFVSALRSNGDDLSAPDVREKAGVTHIDTVLEDLKEQALAAMPVPAPMPFAANPAAAPAAADATVLLAEEFEPLLDAFQAAGGLLSIGVMAIQKSGAPSQQTCGEVHPQAPGLLVAMLDLAGSSAGDFEQIVVTTASGYTVFHNLAHADGAVLVAKYRRKGVVISAELTKVRRFCEDWSSPQGASA